MSLIISITCLTVVTEWAWSRRRGNRNVMLISSAGLIFCEEWWADQVTSAGPSVTVTFSSHSYFNAGCDLNWLVTGSVTLLFGTWVKLLRGGEGFLLVKSAVRIFVKECGSSGTVLHFCFPPSGVRVPHFCRLWLGAERQRYWFHEKRWLQSLQWVVVYVVHGCRGEQPSSQNDGQTRPSSTYLLTAASPSCADISTISYEIAMQCSWSISTNVLYFVFA